MEIGQYSVMPHFFDWQAPVPKRDAFDGHRSDVHSCILRHHDLCCPNWVSLLYTLSQHGVIYNSNIEAVVYLRCTYLGGASHGCVCEQRFW